MLSFRLMVGLAGLGACARVRQGAKLKLTQGISTKNSDCPAPVQEFDDLSCRDIDGELLDFSCCDVLKACRTESTSLLAYALEWSFKYEEECGVVFSDFDYASDLTSLQFVGDEDKLCSAACQTSTVLAGKVASSHTAAGLQEMCDGVVVPAVWEPQLESARWPLNKVSILDELFGVCAPLAPTPPTPAPTVPSTTTTTTRTVSLTAPVDPGVDFTFMTSDLVPIDGNDGILAWLNKITLKRRLRNEEAIEEIAGGHTCREKGAFREQTYYASSLCYWLPDIKKEIAQEGVGLDWIGGRAGPYGQPLCEGVLSGEGKCLKCSVCHDNAMNELGEVNYSSFIEEVVLPPTCMLETEIESICVNDFYLSNDTLINENVYCVDLKQSFETAVARHEQCLPIIQELTYTVTTEIPARITAKEAQIAEQQTNKINAKVRELMERAEITTDCYNYANRNGWPFWYYRADDQTYPTSELLDLMQVIVCVHPGLGNPIGPYNDCVPCRARYESTLSAFEAYEDAEELIELYQRHLAELQATLERKTAELDHWNTQEPLLREARETITAMWEPVSVSCENTFLVFQEAKMNYISSCAPSYYDNSCEKACIEVQYMGCGVMEGTMPNAMTGRGGLRNTCRPPQHSWIHGAWNYGAATEDGFDQCSRVWSLQEPSYAQEIKKNGWLQKAGRFGGWWFGLRSYTWDRRYFALESGDAVRSGILRYYTADPNIDVRAEERHDKFIILWDAKGTDTKAGSTYRRKEDSCFELEHFYRTYIFCVDEGDKETERNEWVSLINPEIRFPS